MRVKLFHESNLFRRVEAVCLPILKNHYVFSFSIYLFRVHTYMLSICSINALIIAVIVIQVYKFMCNKTC